MLQVKLTQTLFLSFYIRDRHFVFAVFQWNSQKKKVFFFFLAIRYIKSLGLANKIVHCSIALRFRAISESVFQTKYTERILAHECQLCTVHFLKSLQLLTNECIYITFT